MYNDAHTSKLYTCSKTSVIIMNYIQSIILNSILSINLKIINH